MGTKLLIFSLAITMCYGHIPIFGDIISATHKVAGTILDGITHGHHFNVEGNVGIETETRHQSNHKSTNRPEETIIIVVENEDNSNKYSPGNYRPPQHNQKPFNNQGSYGHGYNQHRPNQNTPHSYGNENFNNNYNNNFRPGGVNNGRPQNYYNNNQHQGHKPNRYPNYPNQQYPNNGNHQYPPPNGNNGFYDQSNGNNFNAYKPGPNSWNNNNGIPSQSPPFNGNNQQNNGYPNPSNNNGITSHPPPFNNNNQQNNVYPNDIYNNGNANSDGSHFVKNPTTEYLTNGPFSTVKPIENTKKPNNDVPLFIPLLPDENKNTAPKREADNKGNPAEGQEEEFELDVRIKE